MSMFKIMLCEYKNNPFLKKITAAFFVIAFSWQIFCFGVYFIGNFRLEIKQYPLIINDGFYAAAIINFFFFLFVSYYFFNLKNKFLLSECLRALVNKKSVLFLTQGAVLVLISFSYIFILALMNIAVILYSRHFEGEYILYIFKLYALDGFLNSLLAILIGGALALNQKSLPVVFQTLLIAALTTPVSGELANLLRSISGSSLFYWLNYYCYIFYPLHFVGYYVASFRFQLFFAWICFFSLINLMGYFNLRKASYKTAAAALTLGILCFFALFSLPASRLVNNDDENNGITRDTSYYQKVELKEEKADFNITDYDIKFKIRRNLSAEVTLTLDKNELSEYKFTLYHGYKVKKITDENGKELDFSRDFDYITVYSEGALNKIKMFYSGDGAAHCSNSEQTLLPGYFPFYPHSGYKKFCDIEYQGYNALTLDEKANFHIKTDTSKKVYCNLDEIAPNEFSGYAESLTMVAGFYKQENINGVSYIYNYLYANNIDYNKTKNNISENIKNGIFPSDLKKIIIMDNYGGFKLFMGNSCIYSDYITAESIDTESLKETVFFRKIGRKRLEVYNLLRSYKGDIDGYYAFLEWVKWGYTDYTQTVYYLFDECMKKYGLEFMEEKCPEFWESETEERDARQFLRDLLENGV